MPAWGWIAISIAVILVAVAGWVAYSHRRRQGLREQFGPEYDRTVRGAGDRRAAESELVARRERREQLSIRPLADAARRRYAEGWRNVQTQFADQPGPALAKAHHLVTSMMRDRGYPMDNFEASVGDVSVDHPHVVENFRAAQAIS